MLNELSIACRGIQLASLKNWKKIPDNKIGKSFGVNFAKQFAAICNIGAGVVAVA